MALSLTEVSSYTNKFIVPKSTDTIYKNSPVFTRLHSKNMERFEGGTQIQRPLIYAELNGGAVTRGSTFDISFVATDTAMTANMKLYYVNVTLFGFDDILNRGPLAVFSQVESKMLNASAKMAKMLATDMYLDGGNTRASGSATSTTLQLDGLEAWYDDGNIITAVGGITRSDLQTAGTVGGLNASTDTSFNAFSLNTIMTHYGNAWFGADHVDLICTTQAGWNRFWNAIQPLQRFMEKDSDVAKIGFQSFRFNNAEVVVDKYMPANTMYGLNTSYIEWYTSTNPRFQFGFTGFKETANTIDVAGQFLYSGNIIVPNPRTGFKLSGTGLS